MSNSFLLLSSGGAALSVKELHVNFWLLGQSAALLEVGVRLEVPVDILRGQTIDLGCLTPCPIKGKTVQDLSAQLVDDQFSRLLFDREHTLARYADPHGGLANTVDFTDGTGRYLLLQPTIEVKSTDNLSLKIDGRRIRGEAVDPRVHDRADGARVVDVYFRFRYQVALSAKCNALIRDIGILHQGIICDFRLNEVRSIPREVAAEVIPVEKLRFFLVQPSSNKVFLDGRPDSRRYVRILEPEWLEYIQYKGSDRFLVYSWLMEGKGARVLIGTEREKAGQQPFIVAAIVFLVTLVTVAANARVLGDVAPLWQAGFASIAGWVEPKLAYLYLAISGLGSYLVGHIIWDTFLHARWSAVRRRLEKRWPRFTQT